MSFENTINYGNWVVEAFIQPGSSFSQDDWNAVNFSWSDPITGVWVAGDYTFDESGVVQKYSFLTRNDYTGYSWFASIDLNGDFGDFMNHAYTLDAHVNDPYFAEYVYQAVDSSYGQGLANVIDTFPGADPFDPYSTAVKTGFNGEIYFA